MRNRIDACGIERSPGVLRVRGVPERVAAITGFAEAAILSPDERSLYYHKKEGTRFVLYRVVRP